MSDNAFGRLLENQADILYDLGFVNGSKSERERIIALIEQERDNWTRQATFSYKNALTALIEKIK